MLLKLKAFKGNNNMLKLETYKLFKRKIVLVVIAGFLLVLAAKEISAHGTYKMYQPEMETYGWWWFFYIINGNLQILPAFIVVVFSGIFSYEQTFGMQDIILSTKNGRIKCTNAKIKLAFILTNLLYIITIFVPIVHMAAVSGGRGRNTKIQMIHHTVFRQSTLKVDNQGLLLHILVLSFMAVNIILLVTLIVSFLSTKPVISMCVVIVILYAWRPDVMLVFFDADSAIRALSFIPVNAMHILHLLQCMPVNITGKEVQWVYILEMVYAVVLIAGFLFFYKILSKNYKYYAA